MQAPESPLGLGMESGHAGSRTGALATNSTEENVVGQSNASKRETITQKIYVHLIGDSSCLRVCFESH